VMSEWSVYDDLVVADATIKEQAKEIERLKKEVAKLRKSGGWQPIDTAPSGNVLLYYPPEHGKNALSEWVTIGLGRSQRFRNPTHWMPLPKPPVKEVVGE
jgi:hypothetical protein